VALVNRTTTFTTLSGFNINILVDGFDCVHVGSVEVVQPDIIARNESCT
jgi:hypothetical protein